MTSRDVDFLLTVRSLISRTIRQEGGGWIGSIKMKEEGPETQKMRHLAEDKWERLKELQ